MVRPGVARIQLDNLAHDGPWQDVEQVAYQALKEIPLRPGGEQHRRKLRRHGVEDVAPVDRSPHVCRDIGHGVGAAQVVGERPGAEQGEEHAEGNFHDQGQSHGCRGGLHEVRNHLVTGRGSRNHPVFHVAPPLAPAVSDERQRRHLKRLHGNHDDAPPDCSEDAPGSGIRRTERDDRRDEPEVERVADERLDESKSPRLDERT